MQALILAGGKGTRLRPLTTHTPKPILPIAGRPLLVYQLELLKRADVRDVIVSLSYQPQKIEDRLIDGTDYDVRISYAVEASPLGTAGAYRNAAGFIRDTTVVLNGDVLTDVDLNEVIRVHRERFAVATLVLVRVQDPSAYGVVETDGDGKVRRFIEKPKPEEVTSQTINAGVYVLDPVVLDYVVDGTPSMFEYDVFPKLLANKEPVYAHIWNGYWRDVGTPEGYRLANLDVLAERVKVFRREAGERGRRFDPSALIDEASAVDPSCTIRSDVQIVNSVLGPNCHVEEHARIEDSVVRGGSRIGAHAVISGAVIGRSCHLGRWVTAGSGTVLGDKSSLADYSTACAGEERVVSVSDEFPGEEH